MTFRALAFATELHTVDRDENRLWLDTSFVPIVQARSGRRGAARRYSPRSTPWSARARNCYVDSGAAEVMFEALPDNSTLPDKLRALGYAVRPPDPPAGHRIVAAAITERFRRTSSGALM